MKLGWLDLKWSQNVLTAEMDREVVKSFVMNFPVQQKEKDPFDKQMRLYRFVTEAKWYDESEKMLVKLEMQFTATKEKEGLDKAREALRSLQAESWLEEADRAVAAGQLRFALLLLAKIPSQGLEANLNVRVNSLR